MVTRVTGAVTRPDGSAYASASITISGSPAGIRIVDGAAVTADTLTIATDAAGLVDFDIIPGNHAVTIGGRVRGFVVPDAATADFADCLDAPAIVAYPAAVAEAQAARDAAEMYRDQAEAAAAGGGSGGGLFVDGGAIILDAATIETDETLSYSAGLGKRTVASGDVVGCIKQGWSYTVLPLGATGAHRVSADGVLLRANPSNGSLLPGMFGAKGDYSFTTQTGTDDTAALQKMFAYADANRIPVHIPAGAYLYSGQLCNMVSGFDMWGVGKGSVFVKSDSYTGEAFHINFPVSGGMLGVFGSATGGDTSAKNYHATGFNLWRAINVAGQSRATAGTAFKVTGVQDLMRMDQIGVFNIRGSALVYGGYKSTVREIILSNWKIRNCGDENAPSVWFKTDVEHGRATVSGTTVTLTSGSFAYVRSLAGPRKIRVMGTASTTPELTIASFTSDTVATLSAAPANDVIDQAAVWYNDMDGQNNVVLSSFDIVMCYGHALEISCERLSSARRFALNDMLIHGHGTMPDGVGGDLIRLRGAVGYVTSRNLRTNSPEQKDGARYAALRIMPGQTITTDKPSGFDLDMNLGNIGDAGEGQIVVESMGSGRIRGIMNLGSTYTTELIVNAGAIQGTLVYDMMPMNGRGNAPDGLLQIADDQKTKVMIIDPTTPYTASATISAGAVTLPDGVTTLTLDTEGAAATDDLETIILGPNIRRGHEVVLNSANNARDITVKHGLGNIRLTASTDAVLSTTTSRIVLVWDGIYLNQIGASFALSTPPVQRITTTSDGVLAAPTAGADVVMSDGPLTRNVTYTLSAIGAANGMKRRITRNAAGANTWTAQVSGGRVVAVLSAAGQWVDVVFDGSSWWPDGAGTLTLSSGGSATAPAQVTGTDATTGSSPGQIIVVWTAPDDGGSAITGYKVEYRTGAGAWSFVTVGAVTSTTISSLTAGATYDVRVSAINAIGTGTASAIDTATAGAAASYSVAISGLTNNAEWGWSAQYGTTLTAAVTGLTGGETVTYEWQEGTVTRATGTTLALTAGGEFGDRQVLNLLVTINGTPYTAGPYTIRHAPPTALSSLSDLTGTEGDAAATVNVAAAVSGSSLTYTVDANSIGATIDASTGLARVPFNTPFAATTITYRITNSGGTVSRAHSVTSNAITITPFVHSMEALIQNTAATLPLSGTLATVSGATGTLVAVDCRDDVAFTVTVGGVTATLVGRALNYSDALATNKSVMAFYYAATGNGAWSVARAVAGSGTLSIQAHAWRVTGGTMRSFKLETMVSPSSSIKSLTYPATWRNGDMVISAMMNDTGHAVTGGPGAWALDANFTQTSGRVEAYIQSQKMTSDGSATFSYNSVVSKAGVTWAVLTCSQYPAVIATPNEPVVTNYLYPLNQARTSVTIPVAGTYTGASADIYERVVDGSGTEIVGWTLIQSAATGNAYSGSLTIPASGLTALYREARKGTDASTIRRQTGNFQVGLLYLGSGQSNFGKFAEGRDVPPTLHARAIAYECQNARYLGNTTIGNGAATFLNEMVAKTGLPCMLAYASAAGSPIQYLAPGHIPTGGGKNVYDSIRDYLLTLPGDSKIQKMLWAHGENEANAVTQKTVTQYGDILVGQIQAGYAAARGQTISDFPILATTLSTFGGNEGASANYSYRWGYWQGVQRALHASYPTVWLAASALDMVRDSSYHYYAKSTEILGKRLADFAHKLDVGGTQNPWAIASATATSATTTRVTLAHSLGTDFSVVTLPHETGTTTPQAGTTIQGFAVSVNAWSTSLACTAVKVNATTIDLTHASCATTGRKLRYAWGLQGQQGQTPPHISDGLIVDNSALAVPLLAETDFAVT